MKNLIQKVVPFILIGTLAVASVYSQDNAKSLKERIYSEETNTVRYTFGNGYFADSKSVYDNLNLVFSVLTGESLLQKTKQGYSGQKTGRRNLDSQKKRFIIYYASLLIKIQME